MEKCFQLRKQVFSPQHPYKISSLKALNGWQLENMEIRLEATLFVDHILINVLRRILEEII